jgi:tetratricopeptide (TPR) repeat protein
MLEADQGKGIVMASASPGRPKTMDASDQRPDLSGESEVWNAIAAFERILEAMPNDRVALETLYEAYDQIGQPARAIEYLVRLGETIIELRDLGAVAPIIEKLRRFAADDPAAVDLAGRLNGLLENQPATAANPLIGAAEAKRKSLDITGELSLAWNLLQAAELTQEQYSKVVQDLSECSSTHNTSPVTVLHVLSNRDFPNLEKVIAFLSRNSATPVVSLSGFDLQRDAYTLLPPAFMENRGALVFELMGPNDALVAVLNPYDAGLREEVSLMTRKKCHFYLVTADDYDKALDSIRKELQNPAEP